MPSSTSSAPVLRFAFFGAGFWADCQLAAWREIPGVQCVAIFNRTRSKAERLAAKFNIPAVYDDAEKLLCAEKIDFLDIATSNDSHERYVLLAAKHHLPVICQKPMAPKLAACEAMVAACRTAGIPFYIHENYRWQTPIRALKAALASGVIGPVFRARIDSISGFPDITMQPFLAELEEYILADMGTHILDVSRFLFGEAESVFCRTQKVHKNIKGEDVATVMMAKSSGATVTAHLALAENFIERECFPQTLFFVEGERGSIELAPDYWLRITTKEGTESRRHPPARYAWADPAYDVSQAAIVPCHANLVGGLRGQTSAETIAEDNLKTLKLVFASYESARSGRIVTL
ncbi:Gfo/Idh/MocA family protein [Nibricoccus sp. IMCC34717]|uniref:Gfo/Idh/MocA family protein n=1 Tax=Nibricoccus sp. IMCC34717 TaxID=3034021 RepID=UPI00384F11E3